MYNRVGLVEEECACLIIYLDTIYYVVCERKKLKTSRFYALLKAIEL